MILRVFLFSIVEILHFLIQAYIFVIFAVCILSFINYYPKNANVRKFFTLLYRLTEPIFNLIRRKIPTNFGGIDFAPLIILLALQFIDSFLLNLMASYVVAR